MSVTAHQFGCFASTSKLSRTAANAESHPIDIDAIRAPDALQRRFILSCRGDGKFNLRLCNLRSYSRMLPEVPDRKY